LLFKRGIHGTERGGHQQKSHGRVVQPIHPNHPGHGVGVHEHGVRVEQLLQGEIDQTDFRARQQNPRNCEENTWNHQRDDRKRKEERLERRVSAFVHPGERGADHEREQGSAD
jgi:hypothetical protein